MRIELFTIILLALTSYTNATEVQTLSKFPPLAPGQKTYVIQENEASGLIIRNLVIPDGVTLKLAPGVSGIDWTVLEISFGKNSTIDLSASDHVPAQAADGAPPPPQAPYCKIGVSGSPGAKGADGADGHSLTLRSIKRVELKGSLWIKTDGGPGGNGGNGAQAQQGGGPRKRPFGCDAAPGQVGGRGGDGGNGGSTSRILLTFAGQAPDIRSGISQDCGTSSRPNGATGDSGIVSIFGAGGCGGRPGAGGPMGEGGDSGAHKGDAGPGGNAGANGGLVQVTILENQR